MTRAMVPNSLTLMVFEFGIAASMAEINPETGEQEIVAGIVATDDGLETYLDILARQIGDVLTDPGNPWSEVFRRLVTSLRVTERVRAADADKGLRLAAQQIKLTVDLRADPVRGEPLGPGTAMAQFFAACATVDDPALAATAALMRAQIDGATPEVDLIRRRYGHTAAEALALGYALKTDAPVAGFTSEDARDEPASPG